MKEGLPPNSGAAIAKDAHIIPQPRERTPDTAAPQTTADTEPVCANPDELQRENNELHSELEAREPETYRRMAAKLRHLLGY